VIKHQTEHQIHKAVVQNLRIRGVPGLVYLHPANNPRSGRDGARLKALGMIKGAPDLILIKDGVPYALEIKKEVGRMTKEQDDFAEAFKAAGGYCETGWGLDRSLRILETWGLIK
jgi:hypothetical protein